MIAGAHLRRALRRGLAVGHVQQQHVVALLGQTRDRAAHAQFLIIRMRTDDKYVRHARFLVNQARFALPRNTCS